MEKFPLEVKPDGRPHFHSKVTSGHLYFTVCRSWIHILLTNPKLHIQLRVIYFTTIMADTIQTKNRIFSSERKR